MRPATAASADGPMNLTRPLHWPAARKPLMQVFLPFFRTRFIRAGIFKKSTATRSDAFEIGDFGCLGYMRDDQVYFLSKSGKTAYFPFYFLILKNRGIAEGKASPIITAVQIRSCFLCCRQTATVLLLPEAAAETTAVHGKNSCTALQKITSSFDQAGSCRESFSIPPYFDPNRDTIPSYTLSPQKARILLMLSLLTTRDKDKIRSLFETY